MMTRHTPRAFESAWWLPNGHFQTIWPTLFRRRIKNLTLTRERFELSDGDFIDLDWVGGKAGPIVLILHGLEGSVLSPYAQGMLFAIQKQNWRGVLMHFRGCSGEQNRLPRTYHSGETGDLNALIHALRQREPGTLLAAIGFSLGGNVLLKWLGERHQDNPLSAAVAVSVPFELHKAVKRMNRGFSRIYERHLLRCLRKKITSKFSTQPAPISIPLLSRLCSLREFDHHVTAPLHGFLSAEDYYEQSSSRGYLSQITVPTLLLQAKDDPFMTLDLIPEKDELSSSVILEITEKGGHVGFVEGRFPGRPTYWLEERAPLFLRSFLE